MKVKYTRENLKKINARVRELEKMISVSLPGKTIRKHKNVDKELDEIQSRISGDSCLQDSVVSDLMRLRIANPSEKEIADQVIFNLRQQANQIDFVRCVLDRLYNSKLKLVEELRLSFPAA